MARNGSARAGACVVVIVCGALLAGCDGGSDPTTSAATASVTSTSAAPTSSSSPASSSSTSASASESATSEAYVPVKPKFPKGAKENSEAGAVAFVEYYWAVVNYALTKPDAEPLIPISETDCKQCDQYIILANDLLSKSERFAPALLSVSTTSIVAWTSKDVRVKADLLLLESWRLSSSGEVRDKQDSEKASFLLRPTWNGFEWKMKVIGDLG